jgi:hypothetical protein
MRRDLIVRLACAVILAAMAAGASVRGDSSAAGGVARGLRDCSKCNCQHFEGYTSTCANSGCGHSYSDHY